jgi:hypothetical protein
LSKQIARFARACNSALIKYRESIIDHEFVQGRIGDLGTELFHMSCVYSRLTSLLSNDKIDEVTRQKELQTGLCYLRIASRRNAQRFTALKSNDDDALNRTAGAWLGK